MTRIDSYEDLDVWKMAMTLVEDIYAATRRFPKEELYGMTSQMRRAAVSIPANIAEGYGRDQTGQYIQFLRTAQGSVRELETHLLISMRLQLGDAQKLVECRQLAVRVSKMLRSYIRSLEAGRDSQ